jgi:hypothetical protein
MAKDREHFAAFSLVWSNVAAGKLIGMGERVGGSVKRHPKKVNLNAIKSSAICAATFFERPGKFYSPSAAAFFKRDCLNIFFGEWHLISYIFKNA